MTYIKAHYLFFDAEGLLNRDLLGDEINDARYEERLGLRLFGDF